MSTCNFLAVRDVDFADLDCGLSILDQNHSVIVDRCCRCNISVFVTRKCRVCCDSIAFRRHCLTQRILHLCFKACYFMGLICGIPLLDNRLSSFLIFFDDLDVSAFNFLAVRDIDFADLDRSHRILDQKHSVRNAS